MFTSTIGRGRFFAYSVALLVAEIAAVLVCIAITVGFEGLANSKPGPGREGIALAILLSSIAFVILRSNFALRRSRDALGKRWIAWGYVVLSVFFALLQAATFLVYDFGGDNSNSGLNMLGLAITGLWITLLIAPSAGGSNGPDVIGDFGKVGPSSGSMPIHPVLAPKIVTATPAFRAAPLASPARGRLAAGGGFGRRGIA